MSAARVKTVFPLAVHLGGDEIVMGENRTFPEMSPTLALCKGSPVGPPGEKLHKTFQLDPGVFFKF